MKAKSFSKRSLVIVMSSLLLTLFFSSFSEKVIEATSSQLTSEQSVSQEQYSWFILKLAPNANTTALQNTLSKLQAEGMVRQIQPQASYFFVEATAAALPKLKLIKEVSEVIQIRNSLSSPNPQKTRAPSTTSAYDIGQPTLSELYVSPNGDDANNGLSADTPLRTLTAAWQQIPAVLSDTGYRINLMPGVYPCEPTEPDDCRNVFSVRQGTYESPIILRALNGPGTATLRGGMDVYQVSYLYLIDLTLVGGVPLPVNASGNNLLHLADVDHILLRGSSVNGPNCDNDSCNNLQEVLKVNQAEYIYVEDSEISGASQSGVVDYVSVQYGHFLGNHIHTGGEWCMYIKGGTAYQRIEGNEFERCHLGFQAGQSSNFAVMRTPWVHYEVYDIKFVNNLMHDLEGVALSVSGGYNILMAYNTLYQVGYGEPGYGLLQTVLGERGCASTNEIPDPLANCQELIDAGGWGPNIETAPLHVIPNQYIYIYNNLIYNPAPAQTLWSHFVFDGPGDLPDGFQNLPEHPASDNNLLIKGNLIWNGPADHSLGIDETTGCADSHPTCNATQLVAENTINTVEPELSNPSAGDYRPVAGGNVFNEVTTYTIPDFTWDIFSPAVPAGTPSNQVQLDYEGAPRPANGPPGAYGGNAVSQSLLYLPLVVR